MNIPKALNSLKPNACWSLDGDTYDGLQWLEPPVWEGGQKKPTKEEVDAEVVRLQQEWEYTEYQRLRAVEYPDFRDYLDGIVKGDQGQMQSYINACLAVKEKYPKPEGVE